MNNIIKTIPLMLCCFAALHTKAQNVFPASGNTGIGTTTPAELLHVRGSVLSESSANASATGRNSGLYNWGDRAFGSELHFQNGKWGTALFTRTGSDIRLGHYNGNETAQDALSVKLLIQPDGKTGIGTIVPGEQLHVKGSVLSENGANVSPAVRNAGLYTWTDRSYGTELHNRNGIWGLAVFARNESDIRFGHYAGNEAAQDNLNVKMIIQPDGKISIGNVDATKPGYKLFVETGILTEKVKVAIKTTGDWSDHVFNKDYPLMPLHEVETFVKNNGRLPGIPSAKEVVNEGIDLGKMNAKLLEKIEELTLYTIELKKEVRVLQEKMQVMEKQPVNK